MQSLNSLPPFQLLSANDPRTEDLLGPLFDFLGTWTNDPNQGWNLIAVPGPVVKDAPMTSFNNNHGFYLETIPYIETITFTPIAVTLNRGPFVTSDTDEEIQQIGAVLYEQTIVSAGVDESNPNYQQISAFFAERGFSKGTPIHAERGMLLNILNFQSSLPIARMGTIPHGNAILCLGTVTAEASPVITADGVSALPTAAGTKAMPLDYQVNTYSSPDHSLSGYPFYPFFTPATPNQTLIDANQGVKFISTNHIALSSENSGGILNIPFVNQAIGQPGIISNKMTVDYWVSKIQAADGSTQTRLQYVQNINIVFPPTGFSDIPINWPHIGLNTLYLTSPEK